MGSEGTLKGEFGDAQTSNGLIRSLSVCHQIYRAAVVQW